MPIFDQGYQHWSGTLSGHTWRWFIISRQGVRVGMKNPFLRIVVIASWLPAVVLAGYLALWGLLENKFPAAMGFLPMLGLFFSPDMLANPELLANPRHFRLEAWSLFFNAFLATELYISMVVVLLVGPGLISQDLRFNALPLYFSRPLRRIDYFVGKLGVIAWFLGMVVIIPSLLAYGLGMLFSLDITIVWDTFPLLLTCLAYGAVIVVSAGTLMLALSSLSRNSRYIALFWLGLWLVGGIVGLVLQGIDTEQRMNERYRKQSEQMAQASRPGDGLPMPDRQKGQQVSYEEARRKAQQELFAEEMQAAQRNWRPLVSYTANLGRIRNLMLNTDAADRKLSQLEPAEERGQYLLSNLGPQYPWYWSAGVLAVLFGISAWILNSRVRSLDRLK